MTTTENTRRESNTKMPVSEEEVVNNDTKMNFFEMFQAITFLLILVSQAALVFLLMKTRQSIQSNFVSQSRPMELQNLSNCNTYEIPDCSKRRVV